MITQFEERFHLLMVAIVNTASGLVSQLAEAGEASEGRRFNAFWIPIAIVLAGAVAMNIYCVQHGYRGYSLSWQWTSWHSGHYISECTR